MKTMKPILLYLATTVVFFTIDMVWLGFVASSFYKSQIGSLLKSSPNWTAAVIFYLLFLVGLLIFVVYPAIATGEWQHALIYGALFGFFTYATYDLTNLATLKDWPLLVSIVDMAWGTVLSATVATASFFLSKFIY